MAGRHSDRTSQAKTLVIAAITVLAVLIVGTISVVLLRGGDEDVAAVNDDTVTSDPASPADPSPSAEEPDPGQSPEDVPAAEEPPTVEIPASAHACADAVSTGLTAVDAARAMVSGWAAHIQAMDDLQAGVNTQEQTAAIWTATREQGPADVSAFDAAREAYAPASPACSAFDIATMPADLRPAVESCQARAARTDSVLAAGQAAGADWASHLQAMADRRAGNLDPHSAHLAWMAAYSAAPVNIDRFGAEDVAYAGLPPCDLG